MPPRPASPWSRGSAEVTYPPEKYMRPALAHVLRSPRPLTWGRFVLPIGAVRWDVDANGFVWFITSGVWQRIDRDLHRHAESLGWVDSGSLCFVRRAARRDANRSDSDD